MLNLGKRCLFLLVVTIVLSAYAHAGQECRFWNKPYARTFFLHGGYSVRLTRVVPTAETGCRAIVFDPNRAIIARAEDWSINLYKKDLDIDGDGEPDLVLESYSGGAHCCWTYWIIAPSKRPALRKKIENERGIGFHDVKHDGKIVWFALDGSFDYFDDLCHACTVFPDVYLQLKRNKLMDVSPLYRSDYDQEISKARFKLKKEHLEDFIAAKNSEEMFQAGEDIKPLVLTVVLEYLYSGRPRSAWKALDEMWPQFDRDRIKKLIIKTRVEGLLRYVDKSR